MHKINIEKETIDNEYYRRELYTNRDQQLVVMSLLPKEDIGNEKHNGSQFFRIEEGTGRAYIDNDGWIQLKPGVSLIINPGVYHNIIAGSNGLKLYTIYSPPQHPKGTKEKYKSE